jgi:DNA-binding transcriptional MocR family regulator
LSQGALDMYMSSGLFDLHTERMKQLYQRKMQKALEACSMYMPQGVSYTTPETGFFITIELPLGLKAERVVQLLKQDGIWVANADRMFLPEYRNNRKLRLSIASVEEDRIAVGIERLAERIANCLEIQADNVQMQEQIPLV